MSAQKLIDRVHAQGGKIVSFPALARTLAQLSGPTSTILLTSHEPTREAALRSELVKVGLGNIQRVPFSLRSAGLFKGDQHADEGTVQQGQKQKQQASSATAAAGTHEQSRAVEEQEPLGLRSTSILIVRKDAK